MRTTANVADEPSRVDLSSAAYEVGARASEAVRALATSTPVAHTVLPAADGWGRRASDLLGG